MLVKRNPFMRLRFTAPPQLDLLLENISFEVLDHDVVRAAVLSDTETSFEDLLHALSQHGGDKPRRQLLEELLRAGILVDSAYRHPLQDAAEHWQQRGWLDALVLHLRSRDIPYADFGSKNFIRPVAPPHTEQCKKNTQERPRRPDPRDVKLAPPQKEPFSGTLQEVMYQRRSGKPWTGVPISAESLGGMLYSSNGESRKNRQLTAEDSSGAAVFDRSSYSALETYVVANEIAGVPQGVYAYSVECHSLDFIASGDFRDQLVSMCIGQGKVRNCAAAMIIGAHWSRYIARYRHARAYRNLLINTAELAHYYILTATALGLSNFITPAFNDDVAESLLQQRATAVGPLYMVAIG